MRVNSLKIALATAVLVALSDQHHAGLATVGAKKARELTDEDLKRLEKEWDTEDEEDSKVEMAKFQKKLDTGALGATMFFLTLKDPNISSQEVADRANQITQLAKSGGVHVQAFQMQDLKVVVTLQHGWQGLELYDLLNSLDFVSTVEWKDMDKARKHAANEEKIRQEKLKQSARKKRKTSTTKKKHEDSQKDEL